MRRVAVREEGGSVMMRVAVREEGGRVMGRVAVREEGLVATVSRLLCWSRSRSRSL